MNTIGIRREDKPFETRVPLVPKDVAQLIRDYGIEFVIEPSKQRAFSVEEYVQAGVKVGPLKGTDVNVVLGIKEMPIEFFEQDKVYVFFSHTIKGQSHNMPMLARLMEVGATLIDYEKIVDETGKRTVFFGNWAGLAGMWDTFRALGQRLDYEGITPNPFRNLKPTLECGDLESLRREAMDLARRIIEEGIPEELNPLIVGFAGYGNVSRGAQQIFDLLPHREIAPEEIASVKPDDKTLFKCVFREEHMVEPLDGEAVFDLQDYYKYGASKYRGVFERYLPYLTVLVNCIYWTDKYPRLLTKRYLESHWGSETTKLKVIGDISCDLEGAIEITVLTTTPDKPAFTYVVSTGQAVLGVRGDGPVVVAVDNLPCELPRESSSSFSESLKPLIPFLARADFTRPFKDLDLPSSLKDAVIVYRGSLTKPYEYLQQYLEGVNRR